MPNGMVDMGWSLFWYWWVQIFCFSEMNTGGYGQDLGSWIMLGHGWLMDFIPEVHLAGGLYGQDHKNMKYMGIGGYGCLHWSCVHTGRWVMGTLAKPTFGTGCCCTGNFFQVCTKSWKCKRFLSMQPLLTVTFIDNYKLTSQGILYSI